MSDTIGANVVNIYWQPPKQFVKGDYYQLSYKEAEDKKWIFYNEQFERATAELKDLKAGAAYVFRVRVVTDDGEGPYSEISDEIKTKQSPAHKLLNFAPRKMEGNPSKYTVPFEELKEARNDKAKSRKLEIGRYRSIQIRKKNHYT